MSEPLLAAVASWSAPLGTLGPCGRPARGEPAYEQLRGEIAKLGQPVGGGPSWQQVYDLSVEILTKTSKDLLVASYLCAALVHREGSAGLQAGLTLCRDLLIHYWPNLYPEVERVRGRVGALVWLGEQAALALAQASAREGDAERLAACAALLTEIESVLTAQLGEASPGLGTLKQAVREGAAKIRVTPAVTAATAFASSTTVASPTAVAAVASAEPTEVGNDRQARQALAAAAEHLGRVAAYRCGIELADASAFRLRRLAQWLEVERLPAATEGKVQVTFPRQLAERVAVLRDAKDWSNLVVAAEKGLRGDAIFWLGLQHEVASALGKLGGPYEAARRAVCLELGTVLARLPGLLGLAFLDGTPFADEPVQAWIAAEVMTAGGAGALGAAKAGAVPIAWHLPAGPSAALTAQVEKVFAQAEQGLAAGKLGDALELLAARERLSESVQARFVWRLAQARLLTLADRVDLAAAQLAKLHDQAESLVVADWDPALCASVVGARLACERRRLAKQAGKPAEAQLAHERALFERLAQLDLTAAMAVEGDETQWKGKPGKV